VTTVRTEELEALFEGTIKDKCFERALALVLRELDSPRGLIGQLDEFGELMLMYEIVDGVACASAELSLLGFEQEDWQGAWGEALREQQVSVNNAAQRRGPVRFHCRRELAAPIRFNGATLGLLYVADSPRDYTDKDAHGIEVFARNLAAVLAYWLTQRRFQRQLDAAEEMANAAAEGERFFMMSRDPMVITDGEVRRANAAFNALLGLEPQEIRGKSLADLTHPKDRELFQQQLNQMRDEPNREHPAVAVEMLTKDGEQRRVEWVGAATEDGRVYAVGRDITALSWAMEDLAITNAELQRLHAEAQAEEQLAGRLIAHVRKQGCLDSPGIQYVASPLGFFNGDATLAASTPDGELRWLLGDFTGHGLAAAIGTVPLAGSFHVSCRENVAFARMIGAINDMLKGLLPPGLFCAAGFLCLNQEQNELQVWNCGLPPILLRRHGDGSVQLFESQSLPLGLLASAELGVAPTRVPVAVGDDVFLFSDGLTEATNADGELFGVERASAVLAQRLAPGEGFNAIMRALAEFRGAVQVKDDLSVVCVTIGHTRTGPRATAGGTRAEDRRTSQESARSADSSQQR
jgi:PAS domain S-box-containing protein